MNERTAVSFSLVDLAGPWPPPSAGRSPAPSGQPRTAPPISTDPVRPATQPMPTARARCGGLAKGLGSAAVPSTRTTASVGNLPVELTSFVGRRQGLADLKRTLASTRLLTLTGAGGVGKTKLALRAGRESARLYPAGVWFVELAPIQDPELVPQAVFTALRLHSSSWTVSTLAGYLAAKRPLLIFDNCEHVHDAAAALAGTLLRACPDLRILATSR